MFFLRNRRVKITAALLISLIFASCSSTSKSNIPQEEIPNENPAVQESTDAKTPVSDENAAQEQNGSNPTEEKSGAEKIDTEELFQEESPLEEPPALEEPVIYDMIETDQDETETDSESGDSAQLEEKLAAEEQSTPALPPEEENENAKNNHDENKTDANDFPFDNEENVKETGEETEKEAVQNQDAPQTENQTEGGAEVLQEQDAAETEEAQSEEKSTEPSRSFVCKNQQYIDIDYPGRGWIYVGESEEEPKFRYFGRRLGTENTKFTLRSMKSGKTILHFYKNDVLTSQYIDDYLEVEVLDEVAKPNERAAAPSYEEAVPQKPSRTQTAEEKPAETSEKSDSGKNAERTQTRAEEKTAESTQNAKKTETETAANGTEKNPAPDKTSVTAKTSDTEKIPEQKTLSEQDTKKLLEQAKKSLEAKQFEAALRQIQLYMDSETANIDEALWIQGQILESESPVKNIKNALDCYDTIIKKYPASRFWENASKRKIFLRRFYVNIN